MLTIDKTNKITMINGDTGVLKLRVRNYTLSAGDVVTLTVKANITDSKDSAKINKSITDFNDDGTCTIVLEAADTVGMDAGTYVYDVQLNLKDGRVDTIIGPTSFTIIRGVTD